MGILICIWASIVCLLRYSFDSTRINKKVLENNFEIACEQQLHVNYVIHLFVMESTKRFWKTILKRNDTCTCSKNSTIMNLWMTRKNKGKHGDNMFQIVKEKYIMSDEAFEKVLAYLPLHALFRARCVCKKWQTLISSPKFIKVRLGISLMVASPYHPMVLSQGYGRQCCVFDVVLNKWQNMAPLDFLPYKVTYVTGASGLLCLKNCFELFVISNPMTKSWRNLPRSLNHLAIWQCTTHMFLDAITQVYKVIVVSQTGVIEIFDSMLNNWIVISTKLPYGVMNVRGGTGAFCNGFIYCIVDEGLRSKCSGVIAYDVQLATWSSILVALPLGFGEMRSSQSLQPRCLSASLIECKGCVMLVAEKLQLGATHIHIFELQLMSLTWLEVTFMPFEFESFRQGLRIDGVVVHGNLICFTSQTGNMTLLDVTTRSWQQLPKCPLLMGKNNNFEIAIFPFIPSLDVLV